MPNITYSTKKLRLIELQSLHIEEIASYLSTVFFNPLPDLWMTMRLFATHRWFYETWPTTQTIPQFTNLQLDLLSLTIIR